MIRINHPANYYFLLYLITWASFYFIEFILPFESVFDKKIEVILFILLFLIITSATMYHGYRICTILKIKKLFTSNVTILYDTRTLTKIIVMILILSTLGVISLVYDKIYLQNIDFNKGFAIARVQWQDASKYRDGISSIFSVFGYISSAMVFLALLLTLINWETLGKYKIYLPFIIMSAVFLIVLSISLISGGRSILLLFMTSLLSCSFIRKILLGSFLPKFSKISITSVIVIILSLAIAFASYIFSLRANMSEIPFEDYADSWITKLYGQKTENYNELKLLSGEYSDIFALVATTGIYLIHSLYIFEGILSINNRSGISSFRYPASQLKKLKLANIKIEPYHFSGYFPTLPGGIYYDLGIFGFLLISIIFGIIAGISSYLLENNPQLIFTWFLGYFVLNTFVLSPFILSTEIMYFPFIIISFIIFGLIKNIFFQKYSLLIK